MLDTMPLVRFANMLHLPSQINPLAISYCVRCWRRAERRTGIIVLEADMAWLTSLAIKSNFAVSQHQISTKRLQLAIASSISFDQICPGISDRVSQKTRLALTPKSWTSGSTNVRSS